MTHSKFIIHRAYMHLLNDGQNISFFVAKDNGKLGMLLLLKLHSVL